MYLHLLEAPKDEEVILPRVSQAFPRVISLGLSTSLLSSISLAPLAGSHLRWLFLANCNGVQAANLTHLQGLPLTVLDLSQTDVDDSGLSALKGLQLTKLSLEECPNITVGGILALREMPLLDLNLRSCEGLDADNGIQAMEGMLITKLDMSFNIVTEVGLEALGGLRSLVDLDLHGSGCGEWGILDVFRTLGGLPLKSLDLGESDGEYFDLNMNDGHLQSLEGLQLTDLNLEGKGGITDEGLGALRNMPLTRLNLSSCIGITGTGFHSFEGMVNLTELDLSFCCELNEDYALGFLRNLPLRYLSLKDCGKIVNASIEMLFTEYSSGSWCPL